MSFLIHYYHQVSAQSEVWMNKVEFTPLWLPRELQGQVWLYLQPILRWLAVACCRRPEGDMSIGTRTLEAIVENLRACMRRSRVLAGSPVEQLSDYIGLRTGVPRKKTKKNIRKTCKERTKNQKLMPFSMWPPFGLARSPI